MPTRPGRRPAARDPPLSELAWHGVELPPAPAIMPGTAECVCPSHCTASFYEVEPKPAGFCADCERARCDRGMSRCGHQAVSHRPAEVLCERTPQFKALGTDFTKASPCFSLQAGMQTLASPPRSMQPPPWPEPPVHIKVQENRIPNPTQSTQRESGLGEVSLPLKPRLGLIGGGRVSQGSRAGWAAALESHGGQRVPRVPGPRLPLVPILERWQDACPPTRPLAVPVPQGGHHTHSGQCAQLLGTLEEDHQEVQHSCSTCSQDKHPLSGDPRGWNALSVPGPLGALLLIHTPAHSTGN